MPFPAVPLLLLVGAPSLPGSGDPPPRVEGSSGGPDFARVIRPILSENCFSCHGPDESVREADARVDRREEVFEDRGGYALVVPGAPQESELFLRIADGLDPMPPEGSGKTLSPEEIEAVRAWIEAGAAWDEHWAYRLPVRPEVPPVADTAWTRGPIDHFVLRRLESEGLRPEPEAGRETLVRRLTLDLTGLPPTPAEVDAFLADDAPDAYERVVERLLASPRFGEHMARAWLDVARYGDTHGFHLDNERLIWPYRDWVIRAFNDDMPFDRFTVEQLAGDLLEEATVEQEVATGFLRLNPTTAEGGFIEEEYLVKYAIDRAETVATTWMGTTLVCAQCHEHKYDPISQREFYGLFAFFNNTAEAASDGNRPSPAPTVQVPSREDEIEREALADAIRELEARLDEPLPEVDAAQAEWAEHWRERLARRWIPLEARAWATREGTSLEPLPDGSLVATGANPDREAYEVLARTELAGVSALRLEVLPHESVESGAIGRARNGNFVLTELDVQAASAVRPSAFTEVPLAVAAADHSQESWPVAATIDGDPRTGWAVLPEETEEHEAIFLPETPFGEEGGSLVRLRMGFDSVHTSHALLRFRLWASAEVELTPARLGPWSSLGPFPDEPSGGEAYERDYGVEGRPIDLDAEVVPEGGAEPLRWIARPEWEEDEILALDGEVCATYLHRTIESPDERRLTLAIGSDDAVRIWCNGEPVLSERVARSVARDQNRVTLSLRAGRNELLVKVVNFGGGYAFVSRVVEEEVGGLPLDVARLLTKGAPLSEDEATELRRHYRRAHSAEYKERLEALERARGEAAELEARIPTSLVARERPEVRPAHVLIRGNYARKGEEVVPDTPAFLPPSGGGKEGRKSRLDLARWLVDGSHPLTARVTVNRFWQELFGAGIVATAEDFGSQGEFPSHPELLDWLALEFSEGGWSVKELLRRIVGSATYRQRCATAEEKRRRDPANRLLSRGPRFRLDAERIRDSVLAVSGLLVERLGGPSVRPYQPDGIWEAVGYTSSNTARYTRQAGEALYRRSLYTFWKRTAPPAAMQIFDAPTREACLVSRARTNTPLQALALMNDVQYVEAARAFATRLLDRSELGDDARLVEAFRCVTARSPGDEERDVLAELLAGAREEYAGDAEAAASLIGFGESVAPAELDPAELAAWTVVCNTLLNLDEFVTKE